MIARYNPSDVRADQAVAAWIALQLFWPQLIRGTQYRTLEDHRKEIGFTFPDLPRSMIN